MFRQPSGYAGTDIAEYGQPGANGLSLDAEGRLTINEHGNHRVTRLEQDGSVTVLAERYEVRPDGTLAPGQVFFDMTSAPGQEAIDGIKVDQQGNLYVSGPGGLWGLSPTGTHLGTITAPRHIHNMAWGDKDNKTLYLCAGSSLYRMRQGIPGVLPLPSRRTMESRP